MAEGAATTEVTEKDFTAWKFYEERVDPDVEQGSHVNAASTLVASGKRELSSGGQVEVYPIGVLESAAVQQSVQLQRLFEIGSTRSYFVPGRVIGSLNLGRTFFSGPNLIRSLYAGFDAVAAGTSSAANLVATDATTGLPTGATLKRQPGDGNNFWIDLASDVFQQGFGLAFYFKDAASKNVGAFYLENCYLQGHSLNISSGSILIMEGCSAQYDRLVPLNLTEWT